MSQSKFDPTISLATAQGYSKRWRKLEGTYNKHHEVHAFLIPIEDLQNLIDSCVGATAVRAYIGVDEDHNEKLMFMGAQYSHPTETHDDMLPPKFMTGKIYDFTRPCPPACGYMSPMENLSEDK